MRMVQNQTRPSRAASDNPSSRTYRCPQGQFACLLSRRMGVPAFASLLADNDCVSHPVRLPRTTLARSSSVPSSAGSAAAGSTADSVVSASDVRAKAVGVLFQLVLHNLNVLLAHPDFVDFWINLLKAVCRYSLPSSWSAMYAAASGLSCALRAVFSCRSRI